MPQDKKQLKVVFAPGCFDRIEVDSQQELDDIVSEIQTMFAGMSTEELKAISRPVTDQDIDGMDESELQKLLDALEKNDDGRNRKKRLN